MSTSTGALPRGWVLATPEQLRSDDRNALAIGPFGSNLKVSDYTTSGVPLVFVRNITSRNFASTKCVTPAKAEQLRAHRVSPGDLLITKMGDPPGDVAIYPRLAVPAVITADCIRFAHSSAVTSAEFLSYALQSPFVRRQLLAITKGVAQQKVSLGRFAQIAIPLAPLPEQQRVVAALDERLSDLDAAVANLERAERDLARYRSVVLRAACSGTLVCTEAALAAAAGRSFETAAEIASRIEKPPRPHRYESRTTDIVEGHAALSVGDTGVALPDGWIRVPLVDIARMESGHTPSRKHAEWWGGPFPWISITDARAHHGGTILQTVETTNEAGLANSAARLLPAGTVCVSRTASVGYVLVMGRPMATSQDFVNWTPTAAVTAEWLKVVFLADRDALRRFGKGTVHKTIYYPEWLSVHIALPPVAEQRRIVAEVDRHLSRADALAAAIDQAKQRAQRLRRAILAAAFEGRLVPQDPADEPASVLLERIRQQHGQSPAAPRPARATAQRRRHSAS